MDTKKNGGILFIECLADIRFLLLIITILLTKSETLICQYRIIADNKEDSCFVVNHYPHYDFLNQTQILGVMVPNQLIDGKCKSLQEICLNIQQLAYYRYKDLIEDAFISIDVLVDEKGMVRGAVVPDGTDVLFSISKFVFSLLKEEEFQPAYSRVPIISTFHFIMRFP